MRFPSLVKFDLAHTLLVIFGYSMKGEIFNKHLFIQEN